MCSVGSKHSHKICGLESCRSLLGCDLDGLAEFARSDVVGVLYFTLEVRFPLFPHSSHGFGRDRLHILLVTTAP